MSTSQILNPISRVPSQISLKNEINFPINSAYFASQGAIHGLDQNTIYSHVNRDNYNYTLSQNLEENTAGFERIPQIRQSNYNTNVNEFDNYSQVLTEESSFAGNASALMNYGDVDIKETFHQGFNESLYHGSAKPNIAVDLNTISYPYSMKTNTQHGSIIASAAGASHVSDSVKNMYRAVEYTKSPKLERVRVKNSEESDEFDNYENNEMSAKTFQIDTRGQSILTSENLSYHSKGMVNGESEKTFVVKLFPLDEQENEVQEMTMYVEK